jgi:hypothetical protein
MQRQHDHPEQPGPLQQFHYLYQQQPVRFYGQRDLRLWRNSRRLRWVQRQLVSTSTMASRSWSQLRQRSDQSRRSVSEPPERHAGFASRRVRARISTSGTSAVAGTSRSSRPTPATRRWTTTTKVPFLVDMATLLATKNDIWTVGLTAPVFSNGVIGLSYGKLSVDNGIMQPTATAGAGAQCTRTTCRSALPCTLPTPTLTTTETRSPCKRRSPAGGSSGIGALGENNYTFGTGIRHSF